MKTKAQNPQNEIEVEKLLLQYNKLNEDYLILQNRNNQLLEFLGKAVHDLKNPVGLVQTFSSLLFEPTFEIGEEQKTKTLEMIYTSSKFAIEILNDLLDYARLESGKNEFRFEKSDLPELIKNVMETNGAFAESKNIRIRFYCELDIPQFSFDKTKLNQAFNHIIDNAIRYSPTDCILYIELYKYSTKVKVTITHKRADLPADEQVRFFDPFFKPSIKANGNEKSTHLGMAISKNIILAHKGSITFHYNRPENSVFEISLPLDEPIKIELCE